MLLQGMPEAALERSNRFSRPGLRLRAPPHAANSNCLGRHERGFRCCRAIAAHPQDRGVGALVEPVPHRQHGQALATLERLAIRADRAALWQHDLRSSKPRDDARALGRRGWAMPDSCRHWNDAAIYDLRGHTMKVMRWRSHRRAEPGRTAVITLLDV